MSAGVGDRIGRVRFRIALTTSVAGLAFHFGAHGAAAQESPLAPAEAQQPASAAGKPSSSAKPARGSKPASSTARQGPRSETPAQPTRRARTSTSTRSPSPRRRREQSVVDTMAGASVVTRSQINQQQPNSIADMLQNVPGVASEVTPNDPGQSINIRGMQDFGRVNVLVDGARQDYQISGHNANGTFYLDPQFVGQADVVPGPVSNIYGSGAIGGVVSFRTLGIDDVLKPGRDIMACSSTSSGARTARASSPRLRPPSGSTRSVDIYAPVPLSRQHLLQGRRRRHDSRQRQFSGRRLGQAQCPAGRRANRFR